MSVGLVENTMSFRKVADVWEACKKLIPTSGVAASDAQLKKELERLALSAPHMLADIGFERDLKACSSEKAVWRRGSQCVIIFSPKQAAAFV